MKSFSNDSFIEFNYFIPHNNTFIGNVTTNQDNFGEYRPSITMQIVYAIQLLILETIGNFLLLCMISYEKFGLDFQKRTVTNQLLSNICWTMILYNIFIMPNVLVTRLFGPQSGKIYVNPRLEVDLVLF